VGDGVALKQKVAMEGVGTFLLCFTVATAACASNPNDAGSPGGDGLAALSIGAMLMCCVYMGGATSGGHFNPAVTLGLFVRDALDPKAPAPGAEALKPALAYVGAQLTGAVAAMGAGAFALGRTDGPSPTIGAPAPAAAFAAAGASAVVPALLAEALGTFALVYVVLNTATVRLPAARPVKRSDVGVPCQAEVPEYFGLAIGFTVTTMALSAGSISGGAFNPAVGLLQLFASGDLPWIYFVGCPVGAVAATLVFRVQNPCEFDLIADQSASSRLSSLEPSNIRASVEADASPMISRPVHNRGSIDGVI
jgi:aquaporin Z